ncbi:FAD/NAD(P)-binding domain-containing protein [Xylariaceae sp. FL0016]|nr:FAD/NAD(P)-binding domain-containing protein [Xylariaceae sp. FL0016]
MAQDSKQRNIVILGGSYAGISVAHWTMQHTLPRLPDSQSYIVVLVSASSQTMCRPACPRALISDNQFPPEKLFVDIAKQFGQYSMSHGLDRGNFRFVHGAATHVDLKARTVAVSLTSANSVTTEEILPFHSLVIATGASSTSPLLGLGPGLDAESLKQHWSTFRRALPTARHIVIAGGGPGGVETAGELGEHLNGRSGWFHLSPSNPRVQITLLNSGSNILPQLRPSIAQDAETYLARVGVNVTNNARVVSVSPAGAGFQENVSGMATVMLENGKQIEADLYIPATAMKPHTSFLPASLLAQDGRVCTNAALRVSADGASRIYALGDCADYAKPAVHSVLAAVPVLSSNLRRDLLLPNDYEGTCAAIPAEEDRIFKEDMRETQMVPVGRSKGVGAVFGYRLPSFLVWLIKGRDYWLWTTAKLWSGKQWVNES